MRSRCGGGCCWRSKRPSARPIADKQRRLLTFVIVGGGPTGVELAGALAEIARQSLRQDFRRIRPESARIVLLEGGPIVLAPFPEPLRAAARRVARAARRRGAHRVASSIGIDADGVTRAGVRYGSAPAKRIAGADRAVGGRRRGVAARAVARRAARSRRPRDAGADAGACRRIPRSSSSATSARSRRTASRCPASRRWRCSRARTPAATSCARSRASRSSRSATELRQHGDDRPRRRRSATSSAVKISGFLRLAVLDLPAHLLADRLPQPLRRDDRVGVGVPHAPAPRAADYRREAMAWQRSLTRRRPR